MAQYIFVQFRDPSASGDVLERLSGICSMLTPRSIRDSCTNTVGTCDSVPGAYYGIQNSNSVAGPKAGALVIGWINDQDGPCGAKPPGVDADGSYAVIKTSPNSVSFFTDQLGSRTLFYYLGKDALVVSTSQRAIVRFKRSFVPNEAATAWFLSSGCQGPFISWDVEISQARPELEYELDQEAWRLEVRKKAGMELPPAGSRSFSEYIDQFQERVTDTLGQVVRSRPKGEVLLPLSGGLDSRTLLALSVRAGVSADVQLVNWGVKQQRGRVYDDKVAARQVAAAYNKALLDCYLPAEIANHGRVLDIFAEASEGRIDHFNSYTDGFSMWTDFFHKGRSLVVRGDHSFTGGLYLDEASARARVGLEAFSDFQNDLGIPWQRYADLQENFDIGRKPDESLARWRDRMYAQWRIPMGVSAFSSFIDGFVENYSPMMSWSLFKDYMGLPDRMRGGKRHIGAVCKRHDICNVPSGAIGSVLPMTALFGARAGQRFLLERLSELSRSGRFCNELVAKTMETLSTRAASATGTKAASQARSMRTWLSGRLPDALKAHIKAKRRRNLSPHVLAYRLVLADKVIRMYANDAVDGSPIGPVPCQAETLGTSAG